MEAGGLNQAIFVQKNLNIAPYYKEYKSEKQKIIRNINFKKQLFAKITRENVVLEKFQRAEDKLIYWDKFR